MSEGVRGGTEFSLGAKQCERAGYTCSDTEARWATIIGKSGFASSNAIEWAVLGRDAQGQHFISTLPWRFCRNLQAGVRAGQEASRGRWNIQWIYDGLRASNLENIGIENIGIENIGIENIGIENKRHRYGIESEG